MERIEITGVHYTPDEPTKKYVVKKISALSSLLANHAVLLVPLKLNGRSVTNTNAYYTPNRRYMVASRQRKMRLFQLTRCFKRATRARHPFTGWWVSLYFLSWSASLASTISTAAIIFIVESLAVRTLFGTTTLASHSYLFPFARLTSRRTTSALNVFLA